ncbi:MAG TPA: DUF4097 family beta strand repeat-containing protein [Pyrinomonadaceae bacterium]
MKLLSFAAAIFLSFYILNPVVIAQDKAHKADKAYKTKAFCSSDNWSNGDKVSVKDLREFNVAATGNLNVDGGKNGGVSVKGENRSDVLVRACVQAWGTSDAEARSLVSGIRIDTGSTIKAESALDQNWSVSYEILVPRNTNLDLRAHNGGIGIKSVDGNIEFATTNGGVSLADLSGSVKGRTTNGGVNVSLTGATWRGSGMDVVTTNGGVHLTVPDGYAATFETGTTNGGFKSDVAALAVQTEDDKGGWVRSKRVTASMNGGGAPIRVVTTNGGIKIGSASNEM